MLGYSILIGLFDNVISTGMVKEIFHSVLMKPMEGGGNAPHAPVNGRWKYVGIDDRKGLSSYCRQSGTAESQGSEKLGGCNTKKYRFGIPHRLVFYAATEKRDHDTIIGKIAGAVMKTPFVTIQRIINLPDELLRSEAPTGRFQFKEHTLYFSIEFLVLLDLQTDNCTTEISCEGVTNPYCTTQ